MKGATMKRGNIPAILLASALIFFGAPMLKAQQSPPQNSGRDSMPGMDMGGDDPEQARAAGKAANDSMSDHDMKMSPHMFMTDLRPHTSADNQRAAQIVETLRGSIAKYKDYKIALADGFRIFMPNLPQEIYHFTNYGYGYQAEFHFDPAHPTSLLYKKTGDGYELVGAMYTAPKTFTNDQLNERVPLSVARWHEHVNLCLPKRGTPIMDVDWKKFGAEGSISTQAACEEEGGRWMPLIFNWMVHVYPFEADAAKQWAH
jgi:hypothetical protein